MLNSDTFRNIIDELNCTDKFNIAEDLFTPINGKVNIIIPFKISY